MLTGSLQTRDWINWRNQQNGLPAIDTTCRLCGSAKETSSHVLSMCPAMKDPAIIPRHNRVVSELARTILDTYGHSIAKHAPLAPEYTEKGFHLVVDQPVDTGQDIQYNRPDLVLYDHGQKVVRIFEVTVPHDDLLETREQQKADKYEPLKAAMRAHHQGYTFTVTPIVVGLLGTTSNNFREHLEAVPCRDHEKLRQRLVRAAVTGTSMTVSYWRTRTSGIPA